MRRPQLQLASPRDLTAVFAALVLSGSATRASSEAAPNEWVRTTVDSVSDRRPVLTVQAGHASGVRLRNRVAVLRRGRPVAAGRIIFVSSNQAGARTEWVDSDEGGPRPGDTAIVLAERVLRARRALLPPGVTIQDQVAALNPGGAFAWTGVGRAVGIESGDRWLVWRAGVPIARAEAVLTDEATALLALTPIVRDVRPAVGDRVTLCPSPHERATRRDAATVLSSGAKGERQVLILATALPRRFREGDRLDVFRENKYVGYARVTHRDDLLVEAETVAAFAREPVAVGDRGVRRAERPTNAAPLSARIFRVEGNVCLLTAGERDGVDHGDVWRRARDGRVEMSVESVHETHCRVRVLTPLPASDAAPVVWEEVILGPLPTSGPRVIGRMPAEMPMAWMASVKLKSDAPDVKPGTVVRCQSRPASAALVIHTDDRTVALYCPKAWRGGAVPGTEVVLDATAAEQE